MMDISRLPVACFAGFFNFIIAMIAVSFIFSVVRNVASSGRGRDDEWED